MLIINGRLVINFLPIGVSRSFPGNLEVKGFYGIFLMPFYTRFNQLEAPFEIQKFVREIEWANLTLSLRGCKAFLPTHLMNW